jgi:protein TonB
MSKVSIYENSWLDLVFEGRNKEYGAYQLRQQNPRTTIIALFIGMLFVTTLASIPIIISYFSGKSAVEITDPDIITPIQLTNIDPNQPKEPEQLAVPIAKEPETEIEENVPLKDPVIVKPIDATENIAKNTENTTPKTDNPTGATGTNTTPTTGTGPSTTTPTVDYGTAVAPSFALDKLPEFPGGMSKFYNYVANNFEKPSIDAEKTITVYVTFVIEKDGSMTDIKVVRNPGYGLDKEAIRVLKSLKTKWKPGMIGGKAVRTSYNLPITVKMESN